MKASKNWLKNYVAREFTTEEIADGLTSAGLEVEMAEDLSTLFDQVVVGEVISCEKHPNADRLSLCLVDGGEDEMFQIICGAPNCRVGLKTPLAKVGARLPGGVHIEKAQLKGIDSSGMLCSAKELGIDASLLGEKDKEGIWELDEGLVNGTPLGEAIGFDDVVFDLAITPNRADCFGMIQIARELSMMYEEKIHVPFVREDVLEKDIEQYIEVEIDDESLSHRYVARLVKDITIEASPLWMQKLLRANGVRPINNIVDITNYVMLETGQPLHAFDYEKIGGKKIIVRRAKKGETILTLDGRERTLDEQMIVISDDKNPLAIAGVMGGANSVVDENTRMILFESAHFDYAHIRNTSRKLGLRSEASGRFERGVSPEGAMYAINRAVDLVAEMGSGQVVAGARDTYPVKQKKYEIALNPIRTNQILGTDLPKELMVSYFKRLGFAVKDEGEDKPLIEVPYYRMDIKGHVDLIEEVARIFGYDNIPITLPVSSTNIKREKADITMTTRLKDILSGLGLTEVITYAFLEKEAYGRIARPELAKQSVAVMNPLSEAQERMRMSLIPGLLNTAHNNIRKNQKELQLFEVGNVFFDRGPKELPQEVRKLSCLITGSKVKQWYGYTPELDFFYLKGIAESIFETLLINDVSFEAAQDNLSLHPGRSANIMRENTCIGFMGEVHPQVEKNYHLNQKAYVLELDIDSIKDVLHQVPSYQSLPKYPIVHRDIAFTIKEDVPNAKIMDVIAEASNDKVVDYRLFDVYAGEQIERGYRSLAYTLTYLDRERTLKDEEVAALHESIHQSLETELGAKLRE